MEIFQNCLSTFSLKSSTISVTLMFRESIFNCDNRCVSHKFMSPPITDADFFISSALENG